MNWNINSQEGIFFIPSFLFIMEVHDMHIKVKEQEFEEGAVGYSLDVPIIRSSHLMQEIIHLGFEPNKVINMAYCALKTEYANKPMDSLQILELIDDNGKSVLEFWAKANAKVGTDTSEKPYLEYNITFIMPDDD